MNTSKNLKGPLNCIPLMSIIFVLTVMCVNSFSVTQTWLGPGNWSTGINWSGGVLPGPGDSVVFNSGTAACTLDISDSVGSIKFTNGYSGEFHFKNLLCVAGSADFRSNGPIFTYTGILQFYGSSPQVFYPKANAYTANQIQITTPNSVSVAGNGFQCVNLSIVSGTLDLNVGLLDSVAGTISGSGSINFNSSILKFAGVSLNLAAFTAIIPGTGTLDFCGNTNLKQSFTPKVSTVHPAIKHTGNDTLYQMGNLKCAAFSQSNGTYNINGYRDTIQNGNFSITNGNSKSIDTVGLSNCFIVVQNGKAVFIGQSTDSLAMNPAALWNIVVTGGNLNATYAKIKNCNASGGVAGCAGNCLNQSSNANWNFLQNNLKIWTNSGGDMKWSSGINWVPAGLPGINDSIVFGTNSPDPCSLNIAASIKSIRFAAAYTGIFKFGNDTLKITDTADFSMSAGSFLGGPGALEFIGTGQHSFVPKPLMQLPKIIQNGTGTTLVCMWSFKTPELIVKSGTFNCGTGLNDTVTGTLTVSAGGTLELSSGILRTYEIYATGGVLDFQSGQMTITGPTNNYLQFSNIIPGTGRLNFEQSLPYHYLYTPTSGIFPPIFKYGLDTLYLLGSIKAQALNLSAGGWNWGLDGGRTSGQAYSHEIDSIITSGSSRMLFSNGGASDTVKVHGKIDLSGLHVTGGMFAGNGAFVFDGSGNQILTPRSGYLHPSINHIGPGTLTIAGDLICSSFISNAGHLDFGHFKLASSSNFSITNGTNTTIYGLDGAKITVGGNATLNGLAGAGNALNLAASAGAPCTLAVTGSLSGQYDSIANCKATVSPGFATNSSDGTGNMNWTFIPPNTKFWTNASGSGDYYWNTSGNWLPAGVPTSSDSVVFNGSGNYNCVINTSPAVKAIALTSGYMANFNFAPNDTLKVLQTLDFHNFSGSISAGSGVIALNGTTTQYIYPSNPMYNALPKIIQNNSAGTLVQNNRLRTSNLTINYGTMTIDTAFTIDSIYIGSSSGLTLSNTFNFTDTAVTISGTGGSLNLGWAYLAISGDMNCASFTSLVPDNAAIKLIGANTKTLSPKANVAMHGVEQINGTTTVLTNGLVTQNLTLTGGTFNLGAGLADSIAGFTGSGGTLDFGSSALKFSGASLDLSSVNINANNGSLKFCGMSGLSFTPKINTMHPRIEVLSGNLMVNNYALKAPLLKVTAGGVMMYAGFNIDTVNVSSGASMDWGSANYNDTLKTLYGSGMLYLNNERLSAYNDVNLSGFSSLYTGTAALSFLSNTAQAFYPPVSYSFRHIQQVGSGTTTIMNHGMMADTLIVDNGTFNLGNNLIDSIGACLTGSGTLDFASCSLRVFADSINLNSFAGIVPGTGALQFMGANAKKFVPKASALLPAIVQNGYNGTTILNNPLKAKSLTYNLGTVTFAHPASLKDSVGSIIIATGGNHGLDLGSDTLDVGGNVDLSDFMTIPAGTGALRLVGNTNQTFVPPSGITAPHVIHSGNGTLVQTGRLKCASFLQTAGAYTLNNFSDTITTGDFAVINGTANSIQGLGGGAIVVQNGNASFSGQGPANLLDLSPSSPWRLDVPTVTKTKTAQYAIVGNCNAAGGPTAQPIHCTMAPGDSNWNLAAVMPQVFDTLGAANIIEAAQRSDGSDTMDIYYQLRDLDNPVDTVVALYRNGGVAAPWVQLSNAVGDLGVVSASDSSVHRHVSWNVAGQLGGSFSSDSMQIGIAARDNYLNATPIPAMAASNVKISTTAPVVAANIFTAPAGGAILTGGSTYSITWNVSSITCIGLPKNYPITLDYSIDNGATFTNTIASNLQNTGTYSWTVPSITSKNIRLRLAAKDSAGNTGYGPMNASFSIDAIVPVSAITFPLNKGYVNGLTTISGSASDNGSGVKSVEVAIKNIATGSFWNGTSAWTGVVTWLPAAPNPPNAWTYSGSGPIGLTNGSTIAIMSRATDSANNVQTMYGTDTVFVDTITPVSTITYPINNSSISSLASISGTATDVGAGVSSLVISIKNETDTLYWAESNGWIRGQTWLMPTGLPVGFSTWTYTAPALTNGKRYAVQSKAMDLANNFEVPGPGVTFTYSTSAPGTPTIAITNRQKYTNNALVSLTLSVQNADSMQFKVNSDPWSVWEQYTTAKTNINIASGGQGPKNIYVEYKDKAGNTTSPVSDSTVYDTIPPACAITTQGTFGPATWPGAASGISSDGLSGVKSVSVSIRNEAAGSSWNSTAWVPDSVWITVSGMSVWNCSLATANLPAALYTIRAFAQDSAGNKSGLSIVSLNMLSGPLAPLITIVNNQRFTNSPMVALILSVQNADSMQFRVNNGPWGPWEPMVPSKTNFSIATGGEGLKRVYVEYKDKAADLSVPVYDSTVYDTTAPRCNSAAHGFFNPSTWPGYFSGSAFDSLSGVKNVVVSLKNELQGTLWNGSHWLVGDPTWLPATGTQTWKFMLAPADMQTALYSITASAFDSAGNKSMVIVDTIKYAVPPVNTMNVSIQNVGDSAISTTWKVDKTQPFMKNVLYGIKYGVVPDSASTTAFRYADTSFVLSSVTKAGMWYVATALGDSAGNKSPQRMDSTVIANTPPVLTAPKDTSVPEDHLWQGKLAATDRNGDTVQYHIANQPAGFIIDSVSGAMSWTPEYPDVGNNAIIAVANDGHGGMTRDTFTVIVLNVPPKIVYTGDTVAHEDSLFLVHIQITNLGKGDTAGYTKKTIPPWMKLSSDTLVGVPGASDVGKDTIYLAASEKGGLGDTLRKIITVLHTNHPPKIKVWSRPDSIYQYSATAWSFIATDSDKGDSLAITWLDKPAWLAQITCDIQGPDRKFTLGGTPQAPDIKWARFSFAVHDTAGASFTIRDSLFIVALPTTIIHKDKRQISYGAAKYVVSGTDYLDTALTFLTSLRSLDDTSALAVEKTTTGTVSFYPLMDGRYEFRAQAIDRQGLKDPNAPKDTFVISGASHHIFADSIWNMVSIPGISVPVSMVAGKGYILHWDESGAQQDIYSYYKKPPDIVQTAPGMSYWRKSPDTVIVVLKRQDVRDTTINVKLIKGEYGWNQIASPYPYPVKWSNSTVAWKWNSQTQDYEEADSVLEPWKGYWVVADSQAVVRVDNTPVFTSATLAKKQSVYFAGKSDWQVKVKLVTGKGMDAENKIGFSRLAQDGFDRLDLPKPPRLKNDRYVFFPHADWNRPIKEFASDIRREMHHINVFQIGVAPSQGDTKNSLLSVDGVENLSSLYCFLVDPRQVTALLPGKQYPVEPSGSVLYKQIFVTDDKNFIRNFPRSFALGNPYPNPCRPTTNINYVLPYDFAGDGLLSLEPYQVKIALYDVMGRQVRELVYHKQLPGMYHILWDGKNNSGRIVASGTYFCRLEAGKFSATTRLVMMK